MQHQRGNTLVLVLVVIALVSVSSVAFLFRQGKGENETVLSPTKDSADEAKTLVDTPGLYQGVRWEATTPSRRTLPRTTLSGKEETIVLIVDRTESVLLKDPDLAGFTSYYERELAAGGWGHYSRVDSGGLPFGALEGYEKDGRYFLFGWDIIYNGKDRLGVRLFVEHN